MVISVKSLVILVQFRLLNVELNRINPVCHSIFSIKMKLIHFAFVLYIIPLISGLAKPDL
jgi:hypothetical protein